MSRLWVHTVCKVLVCQENCSFTFTSSLFFGGEGGYVFYHASPSHFLYMSTLQIAHLKMLHHKHSTDADLTKFVYFFPPILLYFMQQKQWTQTLFVSCTPQKYPLKVIFHTNLHSSFLTKITLLYCTCTVKILTNFLEGWGKVDGIRTSNGT